MIPADVATFIAHRFEASDQEAARRLLEGATIHDGSPAGPRLIRCAIVAALERTQELRWPRLDAQLGRR